jgi:flagellar biosynthesis GTPase FlhF
MLVNNSTEQQKFIDDMIDNLMNMTDEEYKKARDEKIVKRTIFRCCVSQRTEKRKPFRKFIEEKAEEYKKNHADEEMQKFKELHRQSETLDIMRIKNLADDDKLMLVGETTFQS